MNIERTIYGTFVLSEIVNGYRVQQQYSGYPLTEAKRRFKNYLKTLKS